MESETRRIVHTLLYHLHHKVVSFVRNVVARYHILCKLVETKGNELTKIKRPERGNKFAAHLSYKGREPPLRGSKTLLNNNSRDRYYIAYETEIPQ
jgi:hypothetical protein